MIPKRIAGATHNLGRPPGWDEARDGNCGHLWVRVETENGRVARCVSAWEPTPEELAILNAGGSVLLSIVGWQPPVWVSAEHSPTEAKKENGK
jgi:hypothetical protein